MGASTGKLDPRLARYRAKRSFAKTPEPSGDRATRARRGATRGPGFVVQKHAARRLHYDFRLEHDGVLLSWSVPKGPSLDPGTRRLAVRTEDHPLDYAGFEGVIPAGEYGGGTVVVWDRGTWTPESDPRAGLRRGRLTFELHGEKLRGRWHLVRTRGDDDKHENWLLFKGRDAAADDRADVVAERPESVLTGRTIEQVGAARDRVWHSNRAPDVPGDGRARRTRDGAASAADTASGPGLVDLVRSLPVDVELTNLDRVLFPEQALGKAALVAYIAVVADRLLAYAADRPLMLVRCPNGVHRQCFFQKHAKPGVPHAVGRVEIEEERGVATYMTVRDLAGLVALAQMGTIEIHTWGCRADRVERPDRLVLDLDPAPDVPWERVVEAALELRARLRTLGLESFVETTGGKGLHVVAPVERKIGWDDFKAFARAVAERMVAERPDRYLAHAAKKDRRGRIFVDWLRNARGATAIAAYSPRARPGATVATPLTWDELERGVDPASFTVTTVPARLAGLARDPWAGYADLRQSVSSAARRAARAA